MKQFIYTAKDENGMQLYGKIEAQDQSAAVRMLKEKSYYILTLKEKVPMSLGRVTALEKMFNPLYHVRSEDLMIFTRELSTMINSGFTLIAAIDIIKEDIKSKVLDDILSDFLTKLRSGFSFSECLADYPMVFSGLYVNLVKAGEASGELDVILDNLAQYLENNEKIMRKLQSAFFYPSLLVSATLIILTVFFLVAIPRFREIYQSFEAQLPLLTSLFLVFSEFLQNNVFFFILIIILAIYALKYTFDTTGGRRFLDKNKLVLPGLGDVYKKIAISRFARTLALLYGSGVPLVEAFNLVARIVDNVVIRDMVVSLAINIQEGETISSPIKASGLFPNMAVHMIDVGERSGALDKMLIKIADLYDFYVENWLNTLTAVLEPFLVVFLGLVIGFIVVIMALPIMRLPAILQ